MLPANLKVQLPQLHAAQQSIKSGLRRFNVLDCGRRFGKNILDEDIAIKTMMEGYPVGWFEPTYKYMAPSWRDVRNILAPVTKDRSEQERRIEIITGGTLEMWSVDSNPDAGRSRKYKLAIINEAGLFSNLMDIWNLSIRATLADLRGGAIFSGTPKGLNDFYRLYSEAEQKEDWARWKFSTYDNPKIPREEIDALKHDLPGRVFQQEVMAEFIEDGGFFQGIDVCAVLEKRDTPEDHKGHQTVMAIDWGQSNDFTVVGVGCQECNKVVDWDRFNQMDYIYQREKVKTMYNRWKCAYAMPERNSMGVPNIELLKSDGMNIMTGSDGAPGFNMTASSKPPLIQALAVAFERDHFMVPKEACDELRSFEVFTMASGHPRFSAPDGRHDDWVIMLAILRHVMTAGGKATWSDVEDLGQIDDYESRWT